MGDISVIIPTWNRADTIEKAVRSALAQTVPPFEVLVCDDGSTDNTRDVVLSIKDPRVRWIPGSHSGLPAIPRNHGIRESKGEWIAFLDGDDEWLPEKLEKQLVLSERLNCKAVCTNAYRFIPGKGIEGNLLSWHEERVSFDDLMHVNQVICSSTLIHKSLFAIAIGFPEDTHFRAVEDYALWLRISTLTDFVFVNEPLLIYRDDAASSIRSEGPSHWAQRKYIFKNLLLWTLNTHGQRYLYMKAIKFSYFSIQSIVFHVGNRLKSTITNIIGYNKRLQRKNSFDKVVKVHVTTYLSKRNILDIVTVAFNNDQVIEQQIRLLKKNMLDSYCYTVADNSPNPVQQKKIVQLCIKEKVPYFQLPRNPFTGKDPSASHGFALNWIYRNYILPRKPAFWGFIDHDIFPIRTTKIVEYLKNFPVYGHLQERERVWYLWAGFCFFRSDYVTDKKLDFMPAKNRDTGGKNWETVYSLLDKNNLPALRHEYGQLRDGNDPQSDLFEFIGDWVHTFNASYWRKAQDKENLVNALLNQY